MLLLDVTVQWFRNFTHPQTMAADSAVTALIGKNESGKTTVLQALHRLNPANRFEDSDFKLTTEYPRRSFSRHRRTKDLNEVAPISARFAIEPTDMDAVTQILGFAPPVEAVVTMTRYYDGALTLAVACSQAGVLSTIADEAGIEQEDLAGLLHSEDPTSAAKDLAAQLAQDGHAARAAAIKKIPAGLKKYTPLLDAELPNEQQDQLLKLMPQFFYFSAYEQLQGECDLNDLAARVESGERRQGDDTMIALLRLAGEEPKGFLDEDYTSRTAELQAASSDLTGQVMCYWKQNPSLSVRFDTDMPVVDHTAEGYEIRHRFLKINLYDARHDVDTNFSTRSSGFQWFFSFLAAFSTYQGSNERIVVLLDEPGTSLHGEAQGDFLTYIFKELGSHQQVVYTTHSQHMIDPTRYETMRAIHDRATREEPDLGVVITSVDLSADRTTILPVEAALGYSVAQHLFLGAGPHLAVEGSSDFVFLLQLSTYLRGLGRTGLDPRLSIIPVGGVGNMPAYVALMGRRLDVRALVDGAETKGAVKRVRAAAEAVGIEPRKIVALGELDGLPATADIEDLFTVKDYLWLYALAGHPPISESDLSATNEPILRRITSVRGDDFDHSIPAHRLTENLSEFLAQIDEETLRRFEELFVRLSVE
ncbi:AAA family ATPase [Nonomuraea cavernae]|uniref:Endonuclease GajA/Old nuclease/RecF-like AAA domain-containing protein n=1 Tax=Nonomuraea cavernae TaxID=2045107 RepID=A0A917ZGF6_9ACTN|nr:AAA family ATPase [Nonomuraea cavernae]MCA2190602.1 AAA family ATPase [Nonomuraea cavernae]GGO81392.1 hypothetical protein GCM10012289_70260 [Nonomuraea cavernae]